MHHSGSGSVKYGMHVNNYQGIINGASVQYFVQEISCVRAVTRNKLFRSWALCVLLSNCVQIRCSLSKSSSSKVKRLDFETDPLTDPIWCLYHGCVRWTGLTWTMTDSTLPYTSVVTSDSIYDCDFKLVSAPLPYSPDLASSYPSSLISKGN